MAFLASPCSREPLSLTRSRRRHLRVGRMEVMYIEAAPVSPLSFMFALIAGSANQ